MASPPIPVGWRGYPQYFEIPGAFRVYRVISGGVIGAAWGTLVDIRSAVLAAQADVAAQLSAAGLTAADMIARAVLKRVDVVNADTADNLQLATQNPPSPTNAIAKAYANFGSVYMRFPTWQGATVVYASAEFGTISEAAVEVWFDIPTVSAAGQ